MITKGPVLCLSVFFTALVFCLLLTSCGLFYYDDFRSVTETVNSSENIIGSGNNFYVNEVIDGDTFSISTGDKVRMLGINTPEIDRYYYSEAKNILDIMIGGKQVELEKDITDRDSYGRLLRYVHIGDVFVNLEMVKRGYANVYTLPPDIRYSEELLMAERHARQNGLGLWAQSRRLYNIRLLLNYDAEGDDCSNNNDEYVVLRNSCQDISMKDWQIKDEARHIYTFENFVAKKETSFILYTGKGQDTETELFWNYGCSIWNNDHDTLFLYDEQGNLVLEYNY